MTPTPDPKNLAFRTWRWLTRQRTSTPPLSSLSDHMRRDIGVPLDTNRRDIRSLHDAMRYSG